MVRLLGLPESVQNMVTEGTISAGHARALISAPNPTLLAQEVAAKGLSVRQTEKMAAENSGRQVQPRGGKSSGPTFKDPNTLALEKDLTNILGLKVTISMGSDNTDGRISIDFKNLDQLDDVLLRLSKFPKV
jgi:ParB family chromosome partitioning protein